MHAPHADSPVFPPNISFGGGVAITYFALAKKLSSRPGTEVWVGDLIEGRGERRRRLHRAEIDR